MYRVDDRAGPHPHWVTVCDYCGMPITDVDPGGPVIPRALRMGKTYLIRQGHVGGCQFALEERLAAESRDPPAVGGADV